MKKDKIFLNTKLDELNFLPETYNYLKKLEIKTIGDLVVKNKFDLKKTKIPESAFLEVVNKVHSLGLTFNDDIIENRIGELTLNSPIGFLGIPNNIVLFLKNNGNIQTISDLTNMTEQEITKIIPNKYLRQEILFKVHCKGFKLLDEKKPSLIEIEKDILETQKMILVDSYGVFIMAKTESIMQKKFINQELKKIKKQISDIDKKILLPKFETIKTLLEIKRKILIDSYGITIIEKEKVEIRISYINKELSKVKKALSNIEEKIKISVDQYSDYKKKKQPKL